MVLELNIKKDNDLSVLQEKEQDEQREIITIAEMYCDSCLNDPNCLKVERENATSTRLSSVLCSFALGIVGSLLASVIFEFYLGRVLRTVLG